MNDQTLRQNIIDELDWVPSIDSAGIGVAVSDGVVTLTGHVPNYAQKSLAENAVKRVKGVRAIAEELKVASDGSNPYADDDIAKRAVTVLDLNVLVPLNSMQVKAQQGWLTLTGEVEWDYQRTAAVNDLRKLRGVMGITNSVTLKPRATVSNIIQKIEDAFRRSAQLEAKGIRVNVSDGKVRLDGEVDSWADRRTLENAVWSAPGVRAVDDHVRVV